MRKHPHRVWNRATDTCSLPEPYIGHIHVFIAKGTSAAIRKHETHFEMVQVTLHFTAERNCIYIYIYMTYTYIQRLYTHIKDYIYIYFFTRLHPFASRVHRPPRKVLALHANFATPCLGPIHFRSTHGLYLVKSLCPRTLQ